MRRNEVQYLAVPAIDSSKLASQMRTAFSSTVRNRLNVAGGATDDLKDLRRGCLLF